MEPISAPNLMSLLPPISQDQNLERKGCRPHWADFIVNINLEWGVGTGKKPFLGPFSPKIKSLAFYWGRCKKAYCVQGTKTSDILKRKSLPQYLGQKKTLGESNFHAVRILKHLCGVAHVMKIKYFWPEASITAIHTGNPPAKWHPYSRWR